MTRHKDSINYDATIRAVFDNIDTGVVVIDADCRITFWNKWLSDNLHITKEQALNKSITEVFTDLTPEVKTAVDEVMQTGNPRVLSPALHPLWVPGANMVRQYVKVVPFEADDDTIAGAVITIQDMTARFEYERNLQEKMQREWRQIFQAIGHPAMILDKDYSIIAVNQSAANAIKRPAETLKGIPCYRVFHQTDEPPENCPLKRLKSSGVVETSVMEMDILAGSFLVSCTPVLDDEGNLERVIHIATDITALRKIESLLRQSEERYRALFHESFDAICLLEFEGASIDIALPVETQIDMLYEYAVIKECNLVFAYSRGCMDTFELTGMKIGTMFPRLDNKHVEYIRKFIEKNYSISGIETKEISKDGSIQYFLNSMFGYVENGKLKRIWVTKSDITKLKLATEEVRRLNVELEKRVIERTAQLEQANRELEAFTYSVAHDLRAPLRAINGFSSILLQDYAPMLDNEGKRLFNIICDNANKMDKLITSMLALSRVSRAEMEFSRIDMTSIARSIFDEMSAYEKDSEIAFELSALPDAYGDPSLVRQIWSNLLSNAVKYTRAKSGRKIVVSGYKDGDMCIYSVADNGVGFKPEYAHNLFGVFKRLHKDYEGTGVGLAIVQRIVTRHGGKVWAEGSENEGATFWFSLPAEGSG